ncbi:MAG: hypothetical protein ABJA74_02280 [Lapillicoccus sp.]
MTTTDQTTTPGYQDREPEAPRRPRTGPPHTADSPALRLALVGLLAFVGLGGVFGGIQMLVDPYQPMGMSTHMISRTPFDTFALPGVLLLVLLGATPLLLAAAYLGHRRPEPWWAAAFGAGLMAWIVTQWVVVDARLWLQPMLFLVGGALVAVAAVLWRQQHEARERAS